MTSDASPAPDREVLTWSLFGEAVHELATTIADGGYRPDVLLGIARGGLPLAAGLAYALDVKETGTINVEFYTGVDSRLEEPVVLPPSVDLAELSGRRVLVVDDVADTGRTLAVVVDMVRAAGGEPRSAVVYRKPTTRLEPEYSWRRTDRWIDFPWSSAGPVSAAGRPA
ncbi:phosphoribosyltransferase [Kineococcus indalonis]|uniref:phosphoribosyltransferase n=1 Tax=Kineococcus indalonis TaxID=2696566 RepID=UPI0014124ADA|nr:phosphoribosyltransferase [Kineococcus indalonis]NAZ88552.1 phosphoribosyltransferase [Kineococcus indalonis]